MKIYSFRIRRGTEKNHMDVFVSAYIIPREVTYAFSLHDSDDRRKNSNFLVVLFRKKS